MIVVDTNVIAYYWLPGPDTAAAERLHRNDSDWCAPLLWRSELRNILAGQLRRRRLSFEVAVRIAEGAEDQLRGREFQVASERVIDAVRGSRCSAYDCEFVALARELGVPLVTNDREILRDFPDVAISVARV